MIVYFTLYFLLGRDRDREERGPRGGSYNNPAFNQGKKLKIFPCNILTRMLKS